MATKQEINKLKSAFEQFKKTKFIGLNFDTKWKIYSGKDLFDKHNNTIQLIQRILDLNILENEHNLPSTFFTNIESGFSVFAENVPKLLQAQYIGDTGQYQSFFQGCINGLDTIDSAIRTNNLLRDVNIFALDYLNQIRKSALDIKEIETQARKQLQIVTSGSIASVFSTRKKNIFCQKLAWLGASILVAIAFGVFFYIDILPKTDPKIDSPNLFLEIFVSLILRAPLIIPFIMLFVFCLNQYSKERDIEEQYASKETIANALPAFSETISDQGKRDDLMKEVTANLIAPPITNRTEKIEEKALELFTKVQGLLNSKKD